jgi:hypothetical protein
MVGGMKDIDLSGYTEAELVELNHRVVERLRALRQARARATMTAFRIGDHVSFEPECGHEVVGTIVRLNRKSVTVATAEGVQWRVTPSLLKRRDADHRPAESGLQGDLIDFAARRQRDRGKA